MERSSGGVGGTCMTLVAVAVVSTGLVLISYHLRRRFEADIRAMIGEEAEESPPRQRRPRRRGAAKAKTKKVRFADDVVEPSSNNEEYRRRPRSLAASAAAASSGGGVLGPAPPEPALFRPRPPPTFATRRRVLRLDEYPHACTDS
ncbi:hypothetical protein ACP70R_018499 [Stipagrostis hirtigluma subsp. patula]